MATGGVRGARRLTPTDEQTRLMVKVARMYHERNLKQSQIAEELHISQPRVSRLLKRSLETGIVKTVVNSPAGVHTDLEDRLEARFGLLEAVVVDSTSDERDLVQNLGAATAIYLESTLMGDEFVGISSWSSNLLAAVQAMRPSNSPVVSEVVQLVGGVGDPRVQLEANRLITTFASVTGAAPIFLPAPGLLGSSEARKSLMADSTVQQVSDQWAQLTTALVGIGTLEPSPLLRESGNAIAEFDQEMLRTAGAVGDVCLRFFDEAGTLVETALNDRVMGIEPDQLRVIPRRIGVAGGLRKLAALRGALLGGWINVLVTDTVAATELVGS
ncbi:sugar-binding transcriptional regulator [Rhodococcus sp. NCIMB 12038]|uniref:sugar-binding transcriptional regulator n=1 Tax=Rhodococcus sp. NCIMB 12038 TaxID=933800 RepID=UPI000B3C638B|nr:sugar-binding transcriptional regulator [Rhodococcus sp. NCIMB 12038]OUS88543.1 DNA-binding transcriptional regulator [Rhodococcus sp. NCIMB 12038]